MIYALVSLLVLCDRNDLLMYSKKKAPVPANPVGTPSLPIRAR